MGGGEGGDAGLLATIQAQDVAKPRRAVHQEHADISTIRSGSIWNTVYNSSLLPCPKDQKGKANTEQQKVQKRETRKIRWFPYESRIRSFLPWGGGH